MVEKLIANNLQLTAALKRLCDVLSDVLEGEEVADSRGLIAELRLTLSQAASLDELIEQSTFQF